MWFKWVPVPKIPASILLFRMLFCQYCHRWHSRIHIFTLKRNKWEIESKNTDEEDNVQYGVVSKVLKSKKKTEKRINIIFHIVFRKIDIYFGMDPLTFTDCSSMFIFTFSFYSVLLTACNLMLNIFSSLCVPLQHFYWQYRKVISLKIS